jgi:hypothetical protein
LAVLLTASAPSRWPHTVTGARAKNFKGLSPNPLSGDTVMPLSDTAIRNAKAKDKPYKLADEKGPYALINQAGKYWRFDCRFEGKRKTLAFGVYPDVPLKDAREKRDEARRKIAAGIDPGAERKATKTAQAETFEAIAREWFEKVVVIKTQ